MCLLGQDGLVNWHSWSRVTLVIGLFGGSARAQMCGSHSQRTDGAPSDHYPMNVGVRSNGLP